MSQSATEEAPAAAAAQVDLSRPLLAQVAALGDAYDAWVHDSISPNGARQANAKLIEGEDPVASRWPESLRIFRNTWLESMSHIYWWMIPLIWGPIIVALFVLSITWAGLSVPYAAALWVAGVFLWTFTEYVLHRFLFHYRPRSAFGRKVHFLAHGIHHLDPWDPTRLVFPPLAGLGFAAAIFGLLLIPFALSQALAVMSGLLVGYVIYDLTHYFTHHGRPKRKWGKFVKAWHLAHHHKFWTRLYGVSSPLWDFVFRTGRPAKGAAARKAG